MDQAQSPEAPVLNQVVAPAVVEGVDHLKQLLIINAQMFEGTIRVLSQQNTYLFQQNAVLLQQIVDLTASHTKLFQNLAPERLVELLNK